MFRVSGDEKDVQWKIELYEQDGQTLKQVLKPFASKVEAQKKLRELGEPYGARIKHLEG